LNIFIIDIKRESVFYGQCSELCGTFHSFIPIVVESVSLELFLAALIIDTEISDIDDTAVETFFID